MYEEKEIAEIVQAGINKRGFCIIFDNNDKRGVTHGLLNGSGNAEAVRSFAEAHGWKADITQNGILFCERSRRSRESSRKSPATRHRHKTACEAGV